MKLVVIILSFLPVIITLSYITNREKYDLFEPYTFFCLRNLLFPLLSAVYIAGYGGLTGTIYFSESSAFLRSYICAGLISAFCFFSFTTGYIVPKKGFKTITHRLEKYAVWQKKKLVLISCIFLVISFIAIMQFIEIMKIDFTGLSSFSSKRFRDLTGGYSSSSGYIRWMASLSEIIFWAATAFLFAKREKLTIKTWILLFSIFAFAIVFPVLTSSRGTVLTLILSALVMWHYARKPIKLPTLFLYGCIAFLILATLGAMRKGIDDPKEVMAYFTPFKIVETIGSRAPSGYVNLANIIKKVPSSWNYQYGKTFFTWAVAPIPRSYWPEKPPINIGQMIKVNIYSKSKRGGGGEPTNSIGEFYINFGVFGMFYVLFWWFIGGMVTKKIYLSFKPHLDRNPAALLIYIVLLFNFIPEVFINSFSHTLTNFLMQALPVFLFIFLVKSEGLATIFARKRA